MFARLAVLLVGMALVAIGSLAPVRAQQVGTQESAEVHFARLAFGSFGRSFGSGRGEAWLRDWPEADFHFMQGVGRLTHIDSSTDGRHVRFDDESMFDNPVIYAVKVGYMQLSDDEAAQLREYLLRGGFLIVDDFHGPDDWAQFESSMRRTFPNRPIVEMPTSDEVFHVLYDVDQRTQIPGIQAVTSGRTWEHRQGVPAYWRGIYDDDNRLMVAINFNMDLGDAWEHADDPRYPEPLTALAYRFGINYLVYAMTH